MTTPAILWGAYTANAGPEPFEQLVGRKMSVYHSAAMWAQGYQIDGSPKYLRTCWTALFQNHWDAGRLVMHSWGSYDSANKSDPAFALSAIASGAQDGFLHAFARDMAAFKHPVLFRLNGEMNGSWEPYFDQAGGPNFIAAWRHVVDVFRADGARNVTWVWCPNVTGPAGSNSATAEDRLAQWYPGDDYVDWTGFDTYNWSSSNGAPWMTFDQVMTGYPKWYGDTYHAVLKLAPSKPMLLGEFASHNQGGDKTAWIKDALAKIPTTYPAIRAILWFNAGDASKPAAWPLSAVDGTGAMFSQGISAPPYVGGGILTMPADLQPVGPFSVTARVEPVPADVPWQVYSAALSDVQAQRDDALEARDVLRATMAAHDAQAEQVRIDLTAQRDQALQDVTAERARADAAQAELDEAKAAARTLVRLGQPSA